MDQQPLGAGDAASGKADAGTPSAPPLRANLDLAFGGQSRWGGSIMPPASPAGSNAGGRPGARALSAPRGSAEAASSLLRNQQGTLAAFEAKLSGQLKQSEKVREVKLDTALSRTNTKLATVESQQSKLDQTIAEMRGSCRGLSEELNQHIRYVSDLENRMGDMKRQLADEFRTKIGEVEHNHLTSSTSLRSVASHGEEQSKKFDKRLSDLESLVGSCVERLRNEPSTDDLSQRLAEVEHHLARVDDLALASTGSHGHGGSEELALSSSAGAETALKLAYASEKIDHLSGDSHEVHMQLAAQEERLNLLRTKIDTHDGNHRRLSERIGGHDYQSLVRDMQSRIDESAQKHIEHSEKVQRILDRLDSRERTGKNQADLLDSLWHSPDSEFARLEARLEEVCASVEERLEAIQRESVGGQLEDLMGALAAVSPKLGQQDAAIKLVVGDISRLDREFEAMKAAKPAAVAGAAPAPVQPPPGDPPQVKQPAPPAAPPPPGVATAVVPAKAPQPPPPPLKSLPTPRCLVGFDFDCTITSKHFYKIFAWGYFSGDASAHPHCTAVKDWLEERGHFFGLHSQPRLDHSGHPVDSIGDAVDDFCNYAGPDVFREVFREVLLGGEERIAQITAWLEQAKKAGCEFAIVTAGTATAVLRGLCTVPEWLPFFPASRVWDTQQGRHTIRSIAGQKVLMLRDISPTAGNIILVDDSVCKDYPPEWALKAAQVSCFKGTLPYEGTGMNEENLGQLRKEICLW